MVVVSTIPNIKAGDEIYIGYSDDYWGSRLHYLPEHLRRRIEENYSLNEDGSYEPKVGLEGNVEVAKYYDEDDVEGNLLETLNVIADPKRFYEDEYADVVERLFHTDKTVFQEYVHMDTIWTENHLMSDSEVFIPYALANLLEGMTDQGLKSELRLSDED